MRLLLPLSSSTDSEFKTVLMNLRSVRRLSAVLTLPRGFMRFENFIFIRKRVKILN